MKKTIKILKEFNKYRRGHEEYDEPGVSPLNSPEEIGEAIDSAVEVLLILDHIFHTNK